ncbi:MAG: tRNA (N6-isopentenyl adenosine(37)-C2)-methylthiotransferase MiaB [Desulfobulbaceae bacterium]|nr:tRNA (N6-isopentenyl adenosine(37)-C2)-methylthiotransferase MiaB [Desulfobulbaceae bacterium]
MHPERLAYIETFGCQMNERDSEIMAQLLATDAYGRTTDLKKADVVVINTCSIRGKAEQKAMSLLGRLRQLKKSKPSLVVAVAGCVAQQEGEKLIARMPHVDLVIGPQHIYRLPELVAAATNGSRVEVAQSDRFVIPPFLPTMENGSSFKRFVTIMQGCNNFCTYCVVPYTRGREISRGFNDILVEVEHLAASGIREVTLIGQNVNSYGLDHPATGRRTFPELLRAVAAVDGIVRLRFTTSNPKDLSDELMACFAELPKLCSHFHLPVQSGANGVLKRMNRKYTIETYLERVAGLRRARPDIALATDIIVGFPGETEEEFRATMDLLEKVRYHSAYSFKYSDRPHAKSAAFSDKVVEGVKTERLALLQARQQEITEERNREYMGATIEVMVESSTVNHSGQWSGRASSNLVVNFTGDAAFLPGDLVAVHIDEACSNTLRGRLVC